jgi:uncharacterized membrane protein YbhN (UPF0104 family)
MLELLEPVASTAESLAGHLAGVCLALLALGLVLHAAKMAARAFAWHNIACAAYPEDDLRFRHSLGAYVCGTGTNAVLPARPGELVKLALVRRKAPGTAYQGLASTLVTESLFDTVAAVVAVAAGLALGWASLGGPGTLVSSHPWLALAAATGVAIGGAVAWRRPGNRLRRLLAGTSRGFSVLRQPRRYLATVVSWQVVAVGLRVASILCFLAAFHVPATVGTALVVVCVQSVANLIPLTPNGAGTQQALLVVALGTTASASSVVGFSAGAQLATVVAEVVLAAASLLLMTGSLRWRGLVAEPAAS